MSDQNPPTEQFNSSGIAMDAVASPQPVERWENEGGHTASRFGRIVRDPTAQRPYNVILSHHEGAESERAFKTMREAEAFVRRNTPVPRPRSTLYDRNAGDL